MAVLPPVVATLLADTSDFQRRMAEAKVTMRDVSETGSSKLSALSSVGKTAFLGIAGAAAGLGVIAIKTGDELEKSQAQLQASLKASGVSWDKVSGSVSATGSAATKYGYSQQQVDSALNLGVISTQSYNKAHDNLNVAIELAAAKHVSLDTAMGAVDKATQGNTRALQQLGISLPVVSTNALKLKDAHDALSGSQLKALSYLTEFPDAIDKTSSHYATYQGDLDAVTIAQGKLKDQQSAGKDILDALSDRLSGQASAAADTFQGKVAAMRAEADNLTSRLGLALMPVLEDLVGDVQNVVNWFEKNKGAAELLAGAIGGIAAVAATAFAVDKISGWVTSIQGAIKWVGALGDASKVTAGENALIGAGPVGGAGGLTRDAEGAAGGGAVREGETVAGGAVAGAGALSVASVAAIAVPIVAAAYAANKVFGGPGADQGAAIAAKGGHSVQGVTQVLTQQMGAFNITNKAELGKILTAMEKNGEILGQTRAQAQTAARDTTAKNQQSVLNQMRGQLAADSAKYGAGSAQAHADAAALSSTESKWGAQNDASLKGVKAGISTSFLQLIGLNAKEDKLNTTGAGNLKQSEFIKAVLDNQLGNAKSVLAKDETTKASKQAIDQAKQKVSDTKASVDQVQGHIDQLKTVADTITKTKDTISSQQSLESALGKVNTDTSALKSTLSSGITITKLPQSSTKASGTVKVSF